MKQGLCYVAFFLNASYPHPTRKIILLLAQTSRPNIRVVPHSSCLSVPWYEAVIVRRMRAMIRTSFAAT